MSGSGAAIGGDLIHLLRRQIRLDLNQALSAWVAAAVGATLRRTRAWRTATTTRPTTATTTPASASPAVQIRSVGTWQVSEREGVLPKGVAERSKGAKRGS